MGAIALLQLILPLTSGLLGLLTKSNAPAEIINNVQSALTQLAAVHGTLVTKAQVDALLDTPTWPDPSPNPSPAPTTIDLGGGAPGPVPNPR